MKKILLILLIVNCQLTIDNCKAQQGEWTWMNGDSLPNSIGHYGTLGVFSPLNSPPGLYEPCEWTDQDGNFWLFGGRDDQFNFKEFSNLWKFNPNINQWAMIKGQGIPNQGGIYGTYMVPSITNNPGARGYGVATWVDTLGDLWLFGGQSYDINGHYGNLNDLWRYHIATNEWTWMSGADTIYNQGNYGTRLVPSSQNLPSSRGETNASWTDNNNNLWLFGGISGWPNALSDMWMYETSIHQWIWMKGPNISSQPAVYGTMGIADSANVPSNRYCYAKWKDSNGNFWLFGGLNITNSNVCNYNDLWRFNPLTLEWTWMKGPNVANDVGSGSIPCERSLTNNPSARYENRACWTRKCDNFAMFGGDGINKEYNDIWNFNVASNEWIMMYAGFPGSYFGNYGTKMVSNVSNMPPCRFGSVGWQDNSGNLWMFGGWTGTSDFYNDLWRFVPDTTCPHLGNDTVKSTFNAQPLIGCIPLTVTFNNTSTNSTYYTWDFGDTTYSSVTNPTHTFTHGGSYTIKLIANTKCSIHPDTSTITITVLPPITVTSSFTADTLQGCAPLTIHFTNTSSNGVHYLWNFGDGGTSTAVNPVHTYTDSGKFTVTLTATNDTSQCGRYSDAKGVYIQVGSPIQVTSRFTASTVFGCTPLEVDFTNTSINGTTFHWLLGNGETDTAKNPHHIIYPDSGTYHVTLIAYNESPLCANSPDVWTIDINTGICDLEFPNVFSPNGDDVNDYFQFLAKGYTHCDLIIFNRWGQLIYESLLTDTFWNGKINNTEADVHDGTYYYLFTATDFYGKAFAQKGFITLIR